FIFFTVKYYFSDSNKKKSYRSLNDIDEKIEIYSHKLPVLENDTKNIIEYATGQPFDPMFYVKYLKTKY
ncbi:MAG: hypothetical protein ACO3MF_03315, partial [Acholeplasmataceae bacterium]